MMFDTRLTASTITTNSTITFTYPNGERQDFQVTWKDQEIEENQQLINEIVFHTLNNPNSSLTIPKMWVCLNAQFDIGSPVYLSEEKGIYPSLSVDQAMISSLNREYLNHMYDLEYGHLNEYSGNNRYFHDIYANNTNFDGCPWDDLEDELPKSEPKKVPVKPPITAQQISFPKKKKRVSESSAKKTKRFKL